MPINPNIALSFKPSTELQMQDPLANYGKIAAIQQAQNQNALAQYQLGAAQRADKAATVANELYAKHFDPKTGGIDMSGFVASAAAAGQGGLIPDALKKEADRASAAATLAKTKIEGAVKTTEYYRNLLTNVNTPEAAAQWLSSQYQNDFLKPLVSNVPLEQAIGEIPTDPKKFQDWKKANAMGMKDFITHSETVRHNLSTEKTAQGQLGVSQGQLKVAQDRLAQEATGVVYQEDGQGNIIALPSKLKKGEVPTARMAVAPGGGFQPLTAKPSEAVGKEQMSINQQKATVQGALDAVKSTPDAFGWVTGNMPESARARLASSDENEARAFVFNVVSGVIKERAGTAQSAGEAATLARFLPAEGDNAKVIEDKLTGFQKYLNAKEAGTTKKRGGPEKPPLAPMDQEALKWANSNPADPRAAAIKQRLGM